MQETKVQQILDRLKQAYPQYEISSLSTKQRGGRHLIIIKGFTDNSDIDDWSIDIVYPVMWKMMTIFEKYEDAMRCLRLLFIRNNQFVFHSPDVGKGNAFKEMQKPVNVDVYGNYERQHYVGQSRDINDVLEYLTTTQVWF